MGRELKRVPLDFSWPIGEVWEGFVNPHNKSVECLHCEGDGLSDFAKKLRDIWYGYMEFIPEDRGSTPFLPDHPVISARAKRNVETGASYYGVADAFVVLSNEHSETIAEIHPKLLGREIVCRSIADVARERIQRAVGREAQRLCSLFNGQWHHHLNQDDVDALIDAGRLMDLTHIFTPGIGWSPKEPTYRPTAAEVNAWSLSGFGHDCINQWCCAKAECDRAGKIRTCHYCAGDGSTWASPEDEARYNAWSQTEPPKGEGYQIWSTTTEGHPVSPVFAEPSDLAAWMAENRKDTIDDGTTAEQWMDFIVGPGWAPTMVMTGGQMLTGVQAASGPI